MKCGIKNAVLYSSFEILHSHSAIRIHLQIVEKKIECNYLHSAGMFT